MHKRSLLRRVASLALLPVVMPPRARRATGAPAGVPIRRVRASDPEWPDGESWDRLNRDVGGRLIKVQSPLAACGSAHDHAACQALRDDLQNPYFIGDHPGATQTSGWLDAWMSTPSAYAVAAENNGRRGRRRQLRARAQSAARRQRRRSQLPGHLQCRRLAADLDAGDERHRVARRICRPGMRGNGSAAACRHGRGRRNLDACLRCRDDQGRALRAGRRMHHRRGRRPDPERRVRQLLEGVWHGRRRVCSRPRS